MVILDDWHNEPDKQQAIEKLLIRLAEDRYYHMGRTYDDEIEELLKIIKE